MVLVGIVMASDLFLASSDAKAVSSAEMADHMWDVLGCPWDAHGGRCAFLVGYELV